MKIDKSLSRLTKKKNETGCKNEIINKRGHIITNTTKIQRIKRYQYEQLEAKKLDNLEHG